MRVTRITSGGMANTARRPSELEGQLQEAKAAAARLGDFLRTAGRDAIVSSAQTFSLLALDAWSMQARSVSLQCHFWRRRTSLRLGCFIIAMLCTCLLHAADTTRCLTAVA